MSGHDGKQSAFWTWPLGLQMGVGGHVAIWLAGIVDWFVRSEIEYALVTYASIAPLGILAAFYRLFVELTATRPDRTAKLQSVLALLLCGTQSLSAVLVFIATS
jgi:hypothetical protein